MRPLNAAYDSSSNLPPPQTQRADSRSLFLPQIPYHTYINLSFTQHITVGGRCTHTQPAVTHKYVMCNTNSHTDITCKLSTHSFSDLKKKYWQLDASSQWRKLDNTYVSKKKKKEAGVGVVHQFHRDIRNFKSKLSIQTKLSSASTLCDMNLTSCIVSHRSRKRMHSAYPVGKKREWVCNWSIISLSRYYLPQSKGSLEQANGMRSTMFNIISIWKPVMTRARVEPIGW